jgi:hypothetical protein
VIRDLDPLWASLDTLQAMRPPLYRNHRYAVFACGNYAATRP